AQSMEAQTSLRGAMTGLRRLGVMLAAGSVKTKQRVVRQREIVSSVAGLRSNLAGLSDGMRLPSAAQVKIRTQLQKLDKIVPVVAAKIPVVKRVAMPARMIKALRVAVARQGPLKSIALVKHTRCVVPVFLKKLERVVPVKLSMLRTVRHHAIKHIATPLRIMRSIPAVARPAMAKVVPRFVQRFTISRMITAKLPLAVPAVARAIISQTITRPNVVALSPNVKIDGIAPKLFSPAIPHVPVRALRQTARPPALYQPISAISAAVDYRHAVVAPSIAAIFARDNDKSSKTLKVK
ncbi:MAG: hypothetical protein EBV03_13895, partial [Proteobacteria bacterium]|nr:hypothetical protein [Pseudomonadota bacterium]